MFKGGSAWDRRLKKYSKVSRYGLEGFARLYEVPERKPMEPHTWACNCREEALAIARNSRSTAACKFEATTVDGEHICTACGYYAVWMPVSFLNLKKQRSGGLRYKKTRTKEW